jgi:hypothetical protein
VKVRVLKNIHIPRGFKFRLVGEESKLEKALLLTFGPKGATVSDWLTVNHDDFGFRPGMVVELEDSAPRVFGPVAMLPEVGTFDVIEGPAPVVENPGITPPAKAEPSPGELNEAIDTPPAKAEPSPGELNEAIDTPPAKAEPSPGELNEAIDTLRAEDFDKDGRPKAQSLAALLDRPVSDGLIDAALKIAKPKAKGKKPSNPSISEE